MEGISFTGPAKMIKCAATAQDIEHVTKFILSANLEEDQKIKFNFSDFTHIELCTRIKEIKIEKDKKSSHLITIIFV